MPTLIKRYANRKLYNTETSRYITLKGIAELIEAGQAVQVIDNESGEDITSVTLSQILVDSERSNTTIPESLVAQLLERGDVLYDALRKGVSDASDGLEEFQDKMRRMVRRESADAKKLGDWIAFSAPDFEQRIQGAVQRVLEVLDLPRHSDIEALSQKLERLTEAVETLERKQTQEASDPSEPEN